MKNTVVWLLMMVASCYALAQDKGNACRDDTRQFCSDIQPGGGRVINCLMDHQKDVSDACYDSLSKRGKRKDSGTEDTASNSAQQPKDAASRYSEDQKICAEQPSANLRMQCLRDAKDEYSRAAETRQVAEQKPGSNATICVDCGTVSAVKAIEKEGKSGVAGMIAGGVAGAILGHQIGAGRGKDVATVAGAAGGAYAGNKIEGKINATKTWAVSVRFDNGNERTFNFETDPGLVAGDLVRSTGNSIVRR